MATSSNGDPISDARWAADSGSIAFLGRDRGSERHLFLGTLKDGRVRQLSPDGQDVTDFDRANNTFVFTTVPPVADAKLYQSAGPTLPDIQRGTGLSIFGLLYPGWEDFTFGGHPREVWYVRGGKVDRVAESARSAPISLVSGTSSAMLSLSPNGRYAVVTNAVAQVPASWESYESGYPFLKIVADKPNAKPTIDRQRPTQYNLIDLRSGKISVLINAPMGINTGFGDASTALWSPDGSEVILTNTFLPLEGNSISEFPRSKRPWVVAVDIASREITGIKETPVRKEDALIELTSLEWQMPNRKLVLRFTDRRTEIAAAPLLFQKENGAWKSIADPTALKTAETTTGRKFSVGVHESLNEPPVLMATDTMTGESKKIWDPDPSFAHIQLGEATIYKWHDKAGREWTGGLIKPPDYVAGHRYPLVFQTHGFNEKEFLTDSASRENMSACSATVACNLNRVYT
jgi:dipeptidyl aminopeptidase/acylaminoacyl peptidase